MEKPTDPRSWHITVLPHGWRFDAAEDVTLLAGIHDAFDCLRGLIRKRLAIVERLRQEGVDIARRTVAKYRDALRIPSSVQRKREKAVPA